MKSPLSRLYACILMLFIFQSTLNAQENNPLINSGKVLVDGLTLYSKGEYKSAINTYLTINRSDTNYRHILHELANAYYADSQYNSAIDAARLGIEMFPEKYADYLMVIANSLDNLGKYKEAQVIYDSAIAYDPHAHLLYYNKAVTLYGQEDFDAAQQNFIKSLLINPYYSPSHFFLAGTYLNQGQIVPAFLAYSTGIIVSPENKYLNPTIQLLSGISKVDDDVLEFAKRKTHVDKDFQQIQEIVLSKIALDEKYKSKVGLNDNIVKQLQVICEKLKYNKNNTGFAMQFYVPFFEKIYKNDQFPNMVYMMFSGLDIKDIKQWNQRNKKGNDAYLVTAVDYLNEIRFTRELMQPDRKNVKKRYIYKDNKLLGYGATRGDGEPVGEWVFFNDNGRHALKGSFDENGERSGTWTSYYPNGQVKEKYSYKNKKMVGLNEGWFENGNKWFVQTFKDDELEGLQTIYYFNEHLKSKINYKNGKKEGKAEYFNYKGEKISEYEYKDDKLHGPYKTFYASGKTEVSSAYENGDETGTYISYYENGKEKMKGQAAKAMREGEWKEYHQNGALKSTYTYVNSDITGAFNEYYEDGTLSTTGTYVKKKLDGKVKYYAEDGIQFCESVYDKGRLREITYMDKKGNITHTNSTRKGAGNITFFSEDGIKTEEGFFDKDGTRQGKFVKYHGNGKPKEIAHWKDGDLHGLYERYLPSGQKVFSTNYIKGEEDGYVKNFYTNGQLRNEGWMVNGLRQQEWIYYNLMGDLYLKEYYKNGDLDGYTEYYYPGNIRDYENRYITGWLSETRQYDSTGKVIQKNIFPKGSGKMLYRHFNGSTLSEAPYEHFMINGLKTNYYFDGKLNSTLHIKNEKREKTFTSYFYDGKISSQGDYAAGNKTGVWKYYFSNGNIESEESYDENGELHGLKKQYNRWGGLFKTTEYRNGAIDGNVIYYGGDDEVAVVLNFKRGRVKSYQYTGADGQLIAPIMLKNYGGSVKAKYANGKPSAEFNLVEDDIDGPFKIYYSNGKEKFSGLMHGGLYEGEIKWFFADGKLQKSGRYVGGNDHGKSLLYFPDGTKEMELNYYNDDLHGDNIYYEKGTGKATVRKYFYDFLIAVSGK